MEKAQKLRSVQLYALLTEDLCRGEWWDTAELLLKGGADVIQLREKRLEGGELLERARRLRGLTRRHGALLIINDRPDIAMLSDADGVHLGQQDLPPEDVRSLVGANSIIGFSTHSLQQVLEANDRDVDYIGVGPVFPTETKGYDTGGGIDLVQLLCSAAETPTVAIGGMTPEKAAEAITAGAQAIAACHALCGAEDPASATRAFCHSIERASIS